MTKRRIHDGIAGALITIGVIAGFYVNPLWLLLPGILGVTLFQSAFSGFCPVYHVLDRIGSPDWPELRNRHILGDGKVDSGKSLLCPTERA
jgi:hypothetical protein